jgi:hypothetical protein
MSPVPWLCIVSFLLQGAGVIGIILEKMVPVDGPNMARITKTAKQQQIRPNAATTMATTGQLTVFGFGSVSGGYIAPRSSSIILLFQFIRETGHV